MTSYHSPIQSGALYDTIPSDRVIDKDLPKPLICHYLVRTDSSDHVYIFHDTCHKVKYDTHRKKQLSYIIKRHYNIVSKHNLKRCNDIYVATLTQKYLKKELVSRSFGDDYVSQKSSGFVLIKSENIPDPITSLNELCNKCYPVKISHTSKSGYKPIHGATSNHQTTQNHQITQNHQPIQLPPISTKSYPNPLYYQQPYPNPPDQQQPYHSSSQHSSHHVFPIPSQTYQIPSPLKVKDQSNQVDDFDDMLDEIPANIQPPKPAPKPAPKPVKFNKMAQIDKINDMRTALAIQESILFAELAKEKESKKKGKEKAPKKALSQPPPPQQVPETLLPDLSPIGTYIEDTSSEKYGFEAKDESSSDVEEPMCAICHSNFDDHEIEDVVSPCNCKGSIGLYHNDCFQDLIEFQKTSKTAHVCGTCNGKYVINNATLNVQTKHKLKQYYPDLMSNFEKETNI